MSFFPFSPTIELHRTHLLFTLIYKNLFKNLFYFYCYCYKSKKLECQKKKIIKKKEQEEIVNVNDE